MFAYLDRDTTSRFAHRKTHLGQHITKLVPTPRQTADEPVFEVTGDVNLFAGEPDVMLSKPLEGIAQHDMSLPLSGVVLNPRFEIGFAG